uniref:Uncharacterized protein n=1 Tax=Oryza glaberrima TaxID=4538 RepID=I1Q6J1_ORYGL
MFQVRTSNLHLLLLCSPSNFHDVQMCLENQEPKMEDIIKLETNYSLAELKDLKVVDHVSRPNTFILEMLIESFLNDIIFHISITPTNLLLATVYA